jgi:hypothetical protein
MSAPSSFPTRGATGRRSETGPVKLARGLGWFSIGLGLAELLAPQALARATGLRGRETLLQVYGARELAAGVAILASHDPTPWIWGRIAGDALDLLTLAASDTDDPNKAGRVAAIAAVGGVTLLDVICVQDLHASKRLSPAGRFDQYRQRTGFPRSPQAMRGAASDFEVPPDFRIPEPLRPWTDARRKGARASAV